MRPKKFSQGVLPLLAGSLLFSCSLPCSAQVEGVTPDSSAPPGKCGNEEILDIGSGKCRRCASNLMKSPDGLRCVCAPGPSPRPPPVDCRDCNTFPLRTLWETLFLDSSFLACNNTCNEAACQMLTNMVTLQAFSLQNRAYDLYTKTKSPDLPQLWYSRSETSFPRVSFGRNSQIRLKATKYDARGNFLGWEDVSGETLQLCPGSQNVLNAAFMFGTSYNRSCSLDISRLLQRDPEPTFYELFLQYDDEKGNAQWWPVPVENPAITTSSSASLSSWAFRRFFLVDGLSGRKHNLTDPPETVTLAAGLILSVYLPTSNPGNQPPFLLTVEYVQRSNPGIVQASFSVTYIQSPGTAQQTTDISFGVFSSLAVLYSLLKVSSWARRSRLQNINLMIIVKFFAYLAGSLANVFFLITLGIGIYWLIVFKGQQHSTVEVTLPPAGGPIETRFIIYVLCGLVLKSLDLVHLLITQLTVSIFLIDWEKPRQKGVQRTPTGGDQRAASSVSAWRTFLIANEWNELQTHRKANPFFQLFATLLLLEVVGLKNLASRDLNVNLYPGSDAPLAPWSPILRFGIAASVRLAIGIVQVLISVGLCERFVGNKIQQFADLCSLSNVSVFILMHRCYGFYIHGRSVHGHADVDMDTMHSYLQKEEAPRGTQIRSDIHDQRLRSYHALNRFLTSFLEHRYKDMDYVVKNKFLLERILDVEFQEPGEVSVLYNDENALFGRVLFYNHELTLLIFETLVFCSVDLGAQDFVLGALVTLVVQKLAQILRGVLGKRNLAEKTLVEKQFLI
ncbi:meckelin-like isoform X3 [Sphaerodactylus townsendi]|uniref:meckelin-like isoform X3 n=1 Tax=Sphaerodactylus townsendi TaxID=933632 RepID=UPI0020266186|nr:meckelin-like isoform X3 [Sphaerodactylus townsendi]